MEPERYCPDCHEIDISPVTRRDFVKTVGATAAAVSAASISPAVLAGEPKGQKSEKLVRKLYGSLSPEQKEEICFPWDYTDDRGLLRVHVRNNWNITEPKVTSDFFTADQQELIEAIYFGLYSSDWHERIRKQLKDDAGGYGKGQSIAIFGQPGSGKFQFVMTGRHLTIRCDGDTAEHVAFGGPIFYGHAASGFNEPADHPGNVFWHQGLKANALYQMLDGKQRKQALLPSAPREREVHFRQAGRAYPGLPASELAKDQQQHVQKVLEALIEPYRTSDQNEVVQCLQAQGGIENCSIAFYQSGDIGDDGVWDVWRLEGPSFVWHFRGSPHVHVWVNVAADPSVKISTA